MQRVKCLILGLFLIVSFQGYAQSPSDADIQGVIEYATPPEQIADAIIILIPGADMALHRPEVAERVVKGKIHSTERGFVHEGSIIHKPGVMIAPLRNGVPVKMFLKKFPDRDAYYPIAILPPAYGAKP